MVSAFYQQCCNVQVVPDKVREKSGRSAYAFQSPRPSAATGVTRGMPADVQSRMSIQLSEIEFTVLRQTIAARGTARMALVPVTIIGWAALTLWLVLFGNIPVGSLFSLGVLVAGFEAVHALHVGAERIGRYLQVYYESESQGPRWETSVMAVGPALPGGGIDPLFTAVFAGAAFL